VSLATLCATLSLSAQSDVDIAMRFFEAGGAYCFRVAPEGVSMAEETEWTVMVLTGGRSAATAYRIRTADPGPSGAGGTDLAAIGMAATGVWRVDRNRAEFFERFAADITAKRVRARAVHFAPPGLAQMTARQRAEAYLTFSDRGTRVSFAKVPDLRPDEFAGFATYVPD
jgi:hypothetical protein